METNRRYSTLTNDSSINSDMSNTEQSKQIQSNNRYDRFRVRCLSTEKSLKKKQYQSADDIKQDAFLLYKEAEFNDHNAILTCLDDNNKEVLLTTKPDPLRNNRDRVLFIKFLYSFCAMCSNSFGILDDQLPYECPNVKCGAQYCSHCVKSIQGPSNQYPFACMSCQKAKCPQRNILIENHLIWPSMSRVYGTGNLLELQSKSKSLSADSHWKDIEFRRIHIQSRLNTFQNNLKEQPARGSVKEYLIKQAKDLSDNLEIRGSRMKDIDMSMQDNYIDLDDISKTHRKTMKDFDNLCGALTISIEQLKSSNKNLEINTYEQYEQEIHESFIKNKLQDLPTEQNVISIDKSLEDLNSRQKYLTYKLDTIKKLLETNSPPNHELEKSLVKAKKTLEKIDTFMHKLNSLRRNLRAIEQCTDEYVVLLSDNRQPTIPGSRFIYLLEMLRTETEKLEVANSFPQTIQLMNQWQNDYGIGDNFKPKVLDLCKTIEKDLKELFVDQKCIYSVPYKIGVVGNTSVGKSAIIMAVGNITQFSSMINLERSTFGYLQFDTFFQDKSPNAKKIPITFIDIAGTIDNDTSRSIGNYKELIYKADCDLYMIVFDKPFDKYNQICLEYIQNTLKRQCLLVRSKVDLVFHQFYQEKTGEKCQGKSYNKYFAKSALEQTRQYSLKKYNEEKNFEEYGIFLTAVDQKNDDLKYAPFAQFDLEKLIKKLHHLAATDPRIPRISKLALLASRTVINTCFRRGYIISKSRYQWVAAGASIIPYLAKLPTFFGEKKIRQAFGIHDSSSAVNTLQGTQNSLEKYLKEHQFSVPKDSLKSGDFRYLILKDTKSIADVPQNQFVQSITSYYEEQKNPLSCQQQQQSMARPTGTNVVRCALAVGSVITQASDDIIRIAVPAASGALRVVSITGIAVGVALTPVFAAWEFYSTGKKMNRHLHLLCDDLQVVLKHLIPHQCFQCCGNIQLPTFLPSNEDSSSSDDDDD